MRRLMLTAALALAGAAVSACAPHPIVARDPVPAPTGAESFVCDTKRIPLNHTLTDCAPRHRIYEQRDVVRARG